MLHNENHTRFWPGLLLLIRCFLFIVFSNDFIHSNGYSMVVIDIAHLYSDCCCLAFGLVLCKNL